jgi:glycosyltransferase involved in cell wall biosynthesis
MSTPAFAPRSVARPRSVLAVTSELPWPLDSGGHLRTFHLLASLATQFDVRLVTGGAATASGLEALGRAGIRVTSVEVPARQWPREAWRATRSAARRKAYVMYERHGHGEVARAIQAEFQRERPDLCYLDHLDSLVFAEQCSGVPTVIDLHNVYSQLLDRTARESYRGLMRMYLLREARLLAASEHRASRIATTVLASSRADCDHFESLGAKTTCLVPNGVDCRALRRLPVGREGKAPVILYVGTMSWEPNAQAAVYLARVVLPQVRAQIPGCRLRIVGRDPGPAVRALANEPGVEVAGRVAEMIPHLAEAHALAVPLEAGGGTRLKILEAFAAGLPVVSTPIGCEGIDATSGEHLIVAEREDFAASLCALLRDPSRSEQLATRARALALSRYDWSVVGGLACRAVSNAADQGDA